MKNLSVYIPTASFCYPGAAAQLGREAALKGRRFLLVTEQQLSDSRVQETLKNSCENQGIEIISYTDVGPFPNTSHVNKVVELAKAGRVDGIIGFGDIYTLSIAKGAAATGKSGTPAAAIITGNLDDTVSPYPYFEVPSTVRAPILFNGGLHLVDARNGEAVYSLLPNYRTDAGFLDPDLLDIYSQKYRLSVIMDLLLSSIEGYISGEDTFFSDTLHLRAIGLVLSNLAQVLEEPGNTDYIFRIQQAGFFAAYGLGISSPGIGTITSHILAAVKRVPQPVISTILLPYVLEYGVKTAPEKVSRMGPMLGENLKGLSVVQAADRVVESIRTYLGVDVLPSRLSELGIDGGDIESAAAQACRWPLSDALPSRMDEERAASFLRDAL
ncbi:MAG: iron-containing alcohol dehydrogenase [Spirochaetaceae bacterium]